jgi:hypothetical protein
VRLTSLGVAAAGLDCGAGMRTTFDATETASRSAGSAGDEMDSDEARGAPTDARALTRCSSSLSFRGA